MLSLQKRLANRTNALRSTGPRSSDGKAVVALNSVKGGLFSRALVVPATGETAEALDAFTGAVVNDLDPVGMIEGELAVRVAGVLWRLRRVVRHEAAALSQVRVKLPPHPDEVTTGDVELGIPLPPGASTATRLAYVRARIRWGRPGGEKYRATAQVLLHLGTRGGDERVPEPDSLAAAVWQALSRPMDPVAFGTFLSKYTIAGSVGTVAAVQTLVAGASSETGRNPTEIVAATLGVLGEWAAEGDAVRDQLVTEERNLTAQLLAERERAALAGTLTDEKLLERH